MPRSRTTQALVSSISNRAPAPGSRIDTGTKFGAAVLVDVVGACAGCSAEAPPAGPRGFVVASFPVIERRDADAQLPTEFADGQLCVLLAGYLAPATTRPVLHDSSAV